MITFASYFTMGKAHMWGDILKTLLSLAIPLVLVGPLFWEYAHP
jgi:hypothetical protein